MSGLVGGRCQMKILPMTSDKTGEWLAVEVHCTLKNEVPSGAFLLG